MNDLKQKRKDLGLTQVQAANACGVSRRTYQTYEETDNTNATYDDLLKKLDEMGIFDGSNYIPNVKYIKFVCRQIFKEKYPEIRCAYLYGSYARGIATGKSDVDILVVLDQALDFDYDVIASAIEEQIHKKVNIQTFEQLLDNAVTLKAVLIEGMKIYG